MDNGYGDPVNQLFKEQAIIQKKVHACSRRGFRIYLFLQDEEEDKDHR